MSLFPGKSVKSGKWKGIQSMHERLEAWLFPYSCVSWPNKKQGCLQVSPKEAVALYGRVMGEGSQRNPSSVNEIPALSVSCLQDTLPLSNSQHSYCPHPTFIFHSLTARNTKPWSVLLGLCSLLGEPGRDQRGDTALYLCGVSASCRVAGWGMRDGAEQD